MEYAISLRFPRKSHRKAVRLPPRSARLAEFIGIMFGDGGINNLWQANVTLNSVADATYVDYVADLMHELFGIRPAVRARANRRATVVSLASTSVVDFLVEQGLPRGNKLSHGLAIPAWILERKKYKIACVRGLVDTDGCLIRHVHRVGGGTYRHTYLSFSSGSPELLGQFAGIVAGLGMTPCFAKNGREVWLYSARDVEKYLRVVGSSNERISKAEK